MFVLHFSCMRGECWSSNIFPLENCKKFKISKWRLQIRPSIWQFDMFFYCLFLIDLCLFIKDCECKIERNILEWGVSLGLGALLWCLVYTGWRWRYFEATVFTLFWYSDSRLLVLTCSVMEWDSKIIYYYIAHKDIH